MNRTPHACIALLAALCATGLPALHPVAAEPPAAAPRVVVPQDGRRSPGAPLRFHDNRDGTLTDLVTGLMWEKKCAGCGGPHDVALQLAWSGDGRTDTIWDWLRELNRADGTGFAGHADWRIPTIKELVSIVDYAELHPAVPVSFHAEACSPACTDATRPECSCTASWEYWTATTFADFPAHALVVRFNLGFVEDRLKTLPRHVRAVRGGR